VQPLVVNLFYLFSRSGLTDLFIGSRNNSQPWNGKIDELRISNIARSVDWIMTEFRNQNSPSTFYSVGGEEHTGY
jgi:hypothetical protein